MMLRGYLDIADNEAMDQINGVGVGTSVGLGLLIGMRIVVPDMATIEVVTSFVFYGGMTGLIFELYKFAFSWRHPFRR
jgi:hypothetical protein